MMACNQLNGNWCAMKSSLLLLGAVWMVGLPFLSVSLMAQEKTVTVYVWLDDGTDTARPAEKASLEATRSLRLPSGATRYRQKLQSDESNKNKYVVKLQNAPKSIDIGIDKPGYHSLALCDLAGNEDHSLHVRLFSLQTPLAAPECFALKTQYEYLFRREQQLAPPQASRDAVQHAARLRYADGLLALPNPNRPRKTQSRSTQAMLARMEQQDEDGYNELDDMIDGLFDLYDMGGFEQYVPSQWESTYWVGNEPVRAAVEIVGTHGTYRTGPGDANLHRLEEIDFQEDNDEGGYAITGKFRFRPGTQQEQTGEFRWKVDEEGFRETLSKRRNGQPSWTGELKNGPYFPD
jgi:hypothetical protein